MKGLKKRTIFLMAIVAAGIVTAGCIAIYRYHKINGYGKSFYSDGDSKIEKEIKLFIGSRNLAEKLGYYSMYPYYYQKVKSMEIEGETEIKAIKLSEKDIIDRHRHAFLLARQPRQVRRRPLREAARDYVLADRDDQWN